jgi:hypothetical protein
MSARTGVAAVVVWSVMMVARTPGWEGILAIAA